MPLAKSCDGGRNDMNRTTTALETTANRDHGLDAVLDLAEILEDGTVMIKLRRARSGPCGYTDVPWIVIPCGQNIDYEGCRGIAVAISRVSKLCLDAMQSRPGSDRSVR